jgi:hypothetical protein
MLPGRHPLGLTVALLVLAAPVARAQQADEGAAWSIPLALDLGKVRRGSWSEYALRTPGAQTATERFALTARTGTRVALEISVPGNTLGGLGRIVLQRQGDGAGELTDPARGQLILQVGDRAPLAIAPGTPLGPRVQLETLRAGTFTDHQTITVPAGTFGVRHHRWTIPGGAVVDVWVSAKVEPLGIVRLQTTPLASGSLTGSTLELVRAGQGATSQVRGHVRPFDPEALAQLLRPESP